MEEKIINFILDLPVFSYLSYLQNKYLFSLAIIIFSVLFAFLILFVFNKYLIKLAGKTKNKVDDLIFEQTKKPLFYLILAYGIKLGLLNLDVGTFLTKVINSVIAVIFTLILIRIVDLFIQVWGFSIAKRTKTKVDEVVLPLFHKIAKVVFVIIAFLWVLHLWEINITPYLAGVGISGLILGLALQDSLKNVFGGITLLFDKTFQIGDKVKLESGEVGTIYDIGLRSTKIVTYDHEVIYIPNGYLANSKIQNYTRPSPKVRVGVEFGVEYGVKVAQVRKVVLAAINTMDQVLTDPASEVQFLEMGDFSLKFKAYFWVDTWSISYQKKLEATEKIYDALNKANINIPFPTQTIYLKK